MNRKKRLLCLLLAAVLCLGLTPAAVPVRGEESSEVLSGQIKQVSLGGGFLLGSHSAALKTDGSLWTWGDNRFGQLGDGTTENHFTPIKMMDGVATVSLGGGHSAGLKTDGSLWTWGRNDDGQLGDGTTEDRSTPVKVLDGVAAVSLGTYHSAALKTDGSLWTWGYNEYGQLGDGTTEDRSTPVKVLEGVAAVSLGWYHSAALKTDGSLWSWGYNDDGQLGDGTTEKRSTPVKVLEGVAAVSLGDGHSAALKTDGSLWTWGNNSSGQLGDGTTENRSTSVKVLDGVAEVSLGSYHSAALKTDGSLWTWGENEFGQLGDGTTSNSSVPICIVDAESPEVLAGPIKQISMGGAHSAALKTDGSLWTWGGNGFGQLGDGTTTNRSAPVKVLDGVAAVSLGEQHSAALKTDGSLWTWGYNGSGQLGDGTTENRSTPVKVLEGVAAVSLGDDHSAALKTDGSLWTWGYNGSGQLGDGTTENRSTPVKVLDDVAAVSLGGNHSAALKTDSSLWTWGRNDNGQLGDGTTENRSTPMKVLDDVAAVSLGGLHSAALKTDGFFWTLNDTPSPVDEMFSVAAVSLGWYHSAVLKTDGSLWTWGVNMFGQLGDGTTENRSTSEKVLDGVAAVSLGSWHSAALKTDGSLWTWGDNEYGQLGDGTTNNSSVPICIVDGVPDGPDTYVVTFNPNGGTVNPASKTVVNGERYGALPVPEREGYSFAGWFTAPDGGTRVTEDTVVSLTADQTLYARWTSPGRSPDLDALSYSFSNSYSGLEYPNPYAIPFERYTMIFGNTLLAKSYYRQDSLRKWGGSCFGFTATSGMFFQEGNGVSVDAFRGGAAAPGELEISDRNEGWSITAREFLEAMQISQKSPVIQADYQKYRNKLNDLCDAVSKFAGTGTEPVIIGVYGPQGGHALLGYALERDSATKSRLLVYDCNYPNQERYIDLTTDADGNYTGWYYHLNDKYDWGSAFKGCWITYVPYADFYSVWANRAAQPLPQMEMLTVNANVLIRDYEGNPLATLSDGELTTMREDIYPVVEFGITADGDFLPPDTSSVWLPVDLYDVERTDSLVRSNGAAVLMDDSTPFEASVTHVNQSAGVSTTAGGFSFVVDDREELNQVMFQETEAGGIYDITFSSTLSGEAEEVQVKGDVMAHLMTFAMVNGEAKADAESLASISSYLVNGVSVGSGTVGEETGAIISFSPNGGSGSMSVRKTAEDGTIALPSCAFTPPSPDRPFRGWLVNGSLYQPGNDLTLTADTTAIAQWAAPPEITGVSGNSGKFTVNYNGMEQKSFVVSAVAYSGENRLLRCAFESVSASAASSGSVTVTLDTAGAAYVRVFLLDTASNMPLCEGYQQGL